MTYGVPVVSSNRSCLPEILGEAAMYFDPENYEQMAEVMGTVLNDKDVQMQLQESARENLKRFSWEKLAKETLIVYRDVERNKK
jgi:glycosyltransferase involved in cell wall biosynthesis